MVLPMTDSFDVDYFGSTLKYGRGCVTDLGAFLAERGHDSALVVCGSNVGSNDAVMGPVREGLGERLSAVFDETTPRKSVETIYDGIALMNDVQPDVVVGVGGGSSLDIARQMSVFQADGRSLSELRSAAREGTLDSPDTTGATDVVVVPTTFAGAGVSSGGNFELLSMEESPTNQPIWTKGKLWPVGMFYDPDLYETTPMGALTGSAMNGFNKAIETIYSPPLSPVTDSTAVHSLRHLSEAYPRLTDDDPDALERAITGNILAQYKRQLSFLHAFGHGFARRYHIHQGVAHAVMSPYVLEYVFEHVDARRELLAEGLGIDHETLTHDEVGRSIVSEVTEIRDDLELPGRIRDMDGLDRGEIPAIAEFIADDHRMAYIPPELDPTVEDLEEILRTAW
jgi:alcohol dehydrogenase class IV